MLFAFVLLGDVQVELEDLKLHLGRVFPTRRFTVLRVSGLLQKAYSSFRGQYDSTRILQLLEERTAGLKADRILAITGVDLYADRLNFVFGEAQFPGRIALISLHRLKPAYYGERNGELFRSRVRKEAVHELGHTFGLTHCPNPACVMHFSNSILDTDRKGETPCTSCAERLRRYLIRAK